VPAPSSAGAGGHSDCAGPGGQRSPSDAADQPSASEGRDSPAGGSCGSGAGGHSCAEPGDQRSTSDAGDQRWSSVATGHGSVSGATAGGGGTTSSGIGFHRSPSHLQRGSLLAEESADLSKERLGHGPPILLEHRLHRVQPAVERPDVLPASLATLLARAFVGLFPQDLVDGLTEHCLPHVAG
jgi:hypothetical protein